MRPVRTRPRSTQRVRPVSGVGEEATLEANGEMRVRKTVEAHERDTALAGVAVARAQGRRNSESWNVSGIAPEILQVMHAVSQSIPLRTAQLSDEFFPAHLPVALIDVVFGSAPGHEQIPACISERYCRHFEIARTRPNPFQVPPAEDQETLGDFIGHYDELGVEGMCEEVFGNGDHFPGTNTSRAAYVLRLAHELRQIGVDILQDIRAWRRKHIDFALRTLGGVDEHVVRLLLNYTGDDDFVWGDVNVRKFVASAIGRNTVSGTRAVNLVRRAAYELVISPRYLDHQIWRHHACRSK